MAVKKPWKDWALQLIRERNRCPGPPSFGKSTDMVTEDEFISSISSGGTHPYAECHYLDEMLGMGVPADMQEIDPKEQKREVKFTKEDVEKAQEALSDPDPQGVKTVAQFKEQLKAYVGQIGFKREGVLFIPEPLLKLESYVQKFFDVQD
jgi:hypothetical protein